MRHDEAFAQPRDTIPTAAHAMPTPAAPSKACVRYGCPCIFLFFRVVKIYHLLKLDFPFFFFIPGLSRHLGSPV